MKLVEKCATYLAKKKMTIAFAESATAGRLAYEFSLTALSGKVLKGGIVCYDACVKEDSLKIPHRLIKQFTPESAEVTEELTKSLQTFIAADVHVGVTGLTTSGGSETPEKPVGTMFIHIRVGERSFPSKTLVRGTPGNIIGKTVNNVARLVIKHLNEISNEG